MIHVASGNTSGALPKASAYVSLPRKYRPLRKEKASPSVSVPARSRSASEIVASGHRRIFARRPAQYAGESRKIWVVGIPRADDARTRSTLSAPADRAQVLVPPLLSLDWVASPLGV